MTTRTRTPRHGAGHRPRASTVTAIVHEGAAYTVHHGPGTNPEHHDGTLDAAISRAAAEGLNLHSIGAGVCVRFERLHAAGR